MLYIGQVYCEKSEDGNEELRKKGQDLCLKALKIQEDYFGSNVKLSFLFLN